MRNDTAVGLDEIERARAAIADRLRPTPVQVSPVLSELAGLPVWLKLEHHQITGSFKYRGATHAVLSLSGEEKAKGVVGVSTGNHGRGLALAAREAGIRCIVCMSELVPQVKIDGIRAHGAEVRIAGRSQDDAEKEVRKLVEEEGMTLIPPFDHPKVIAGQGTLGLELIEQVPELRTVLVPLSGGGLISGVAAAIKAKRPHVRIIGVTMERGAAMYASQQAGRPVMVEELPTLADSLGGGIGLDNRYTFTMVRDLVDDIILVSETEIALAISHAYWKERQIVEGSGAVGIAALLAGKIRSDGPLVVILSGGNIDMNDHLRIITCESDRVTRGPAGHA